jgi:hypothetical protein
MSAEVAAAAADLYRVNSPRYQCACGWWSFSGDEHSHHRSGGARGPSQHRLDVGCHATWTKQHWRTHDFTPVCGSQWVHRVYFAYEPQQVTCERCRTTEAWKQADARTKAMS